MKAPYQLSLDEAFALFKTSDEGLTDEAAAFCQKQYGGNVLKEAQKKSKLAILLSQFTDVMILILMAAAVISFIVGERMDAVVILAIIIANAWMGYSQEYNAEQALMMLQQMAPQFALVIRNNSPAKINSAKLVPGDIIILEAGNIVPADARLIEVDSFKTDEASLTGESHPVEKITDALAGTNIIAGDQHNMVFKGSLVSSGYAKAVVTSIGMDTEIGKIASMLGEDSPKTPLQKRLAVFSKQLAIIVVLICLVVFFAGLWRGEPGFTMFLTALSLAVAALPEALPAVIAIALAKGAGRMVKLKALVRKLPAVETLGSVTYICSDKTGTLTQNVMTVEKAQSATGKDDLLRYAMMLDNDVRFTQNGELLGDSTETALVAYAQKNGLTKAEADIAFPLVKKLPFDSERMRMSTLHQHKGQWILFVKGAPVRITEVLAAQNGAQGQEWLALNRTWAAEGLRVLFFAYKVFDQKPAYINTAIEKDLGLLGMAAMIDPPRDEVTEAIRECKTAGIKTVMITGDQPITAKAIAERLGMAGNTSQQVSTGIELEKLTEEEFRQAVKSVSVYARVSPQQKLHFVKALQSNGEFVAMTGDGVNDAPSLKQADIGVAMGITGTDVSKEAADMILLDDNFATIVKAVKEGRRIYDNIRKFIQYVLSCNLGEILTIFIAPILGFGIPLLPIHILWINLVTDGLPGLALVAEPAEKNIMQRPPRPPKENLFAGGMVAKILFTGAVITIAALFVQWWAIKQGYGLQPQQTMVMVTLCLVQLGNALSVRSAYQPIISSSLFANHGIWLSIILTVVLMAAIIYIPFLQPIFKTRSLDFDAIKIIVIVTVLSIVCFEGSKYMSIYLNKKKVRAGS